MGARTLKYVIKLTKPYQRILFNHSIRFFLALVWSGVGLLVLFYLLQREFYLTALYVFLFPQAHLLSSELTAFLVKASLA